MSVNNTNPSVKFRLNRKGHHYLMSAAGTVTEIEDKTNRRRHHVYFIGRDGAWYRSEPQIKEVSLEELRALDLIYSQFFLRYDRGNPPF